MRTACPGVLQLFQNQHTAALAHHEAAAPCVKGQAGCIRIGRGGKCFHAGKAADAQGADAALRTAADHHRLVAVPDAVEGVAYGIGAAGAGRDRAGAHALQTKADGHLRRCHVGNGHGHKVGAYLLHALFLAAGVLLLDRGQTADAAGQDDTDVLALGLGIKAAVCNGFGGSAQCQQGEARHFADFLFVHHALGVKILYLTGQLALEVGGVELGNGADAAFTGTGCRPAVRHIVAQRVHRAKAGDHNSAFFHKGSPLHCHAAVHTEHLPGEIAALFCGKKRHRVCHVLRLACAACRDVLCHFGADSLR